MSTAQYRNQNPPREHEEQAALFQWANANAGRWPQLNTMFSIPNAGGYTGGFKNNVLRVKKMLAEGVRPGVPDILLAYPANGKAGLFIEMKRQAKSTVSAAQKGMIARLQAAGYAVEVCKGWEQARDVILKYLEAV